MNNQIKKGWWIACGGFLFAFIIQAMLVNESYQHERSLFVEKKVLLIQLWMNFCGKIEW